MQIKSPHTSPSLHSQSLNPSPPTPAHYILNERHVSLKLKEDIQVKNNEAQRESRKKEKMERELKAARTDLENKSGELKTKQNLLYKAMDDISRLEQQLKEQRVM